ncbi:PE-PGRS family protein PE_PGRS47-like isoform X2 [Wyeomyia smithii]|uniref:PE-PGRS family protein PE_PGRS47-like isoform X2 n=1 Tax=Wyeomyia smithii TaxID=174621 RepID=UPI0024682054|nr:PE-PGRS family protein PE_PGRS47-like isoform X2 [Wyeomyia smithii]
MKVSICVSALLLVVAVNGHSEDVALKARTNDAAFEEVLVQSSLNVRKSNSAARRHVRSLMDLLMAPSHSRPKRQFGFGASSSNANANAFNQQYGPQGFGASAANAGAQSFYNQGPGGGFGASAANSGSQGFQAGPGGLSGSAGMSGSQSYHLPGNRDISLSYTQGFSVANGRPNVSQGNSISFT